MAEKLTIDELLYFFDELERKLDDFKTVQVNLRNEQYGDIDRRVSYKGRDVTLASFGKNLEKIHMWSNKGNSESSMGVFEVTKDNYKEILFDAINKNANGLCKCNYCGKWVPEDKVEKYVPAGVACDDPECRKKGRADEIDFYSYNLD